MSRRRLPARCCSSCTPRGLPGWGCLFLAAAEASLRVLPGGCSTLPSQGPMNSADRPGEADLCGSRLVGEVLMSRAQAVGLLWRGMCVEEM